MFKGIKVQKYILLLSGLWPKRQRTLLYRTLGFISILIQICFFIITAMELFKDNEYQIISQHLSVMFSPTSYLVKLIIFIVNSKQFLTLYQKLKMDAFKDYPKYLQNVVKEQEQVSFIVGMIYQWSCIVIVIIMCTIPVFTKVDLPMRFSYELGQYKPLMYIFQTISLLSAALNNSALDILAMSLMGVATVQIDILNQKIINFKTNVESTENETEMFMHYLNKCVKHHNEIIQYLGDIESVFSLIFLVQYLSSGALICNIGFQLVHIAPMSLQFANTVYYFGAMMGQLGMYCWYGNEIIIKSTATRDACYECDWINCDVKVKKILIIISERSKRPLFLTAGKFSILSLFSFTTVINTSYSYFALMQRLYNKTQI